MKRYAKHFSCLLLSLCFLAGAACAQTEPGDEAYYKAANILAGKEQARARLPEMLQLYLDATHNELASVGFASPFAGDAFYEAPLFTVHPFII